MTENNSLLGLLDALNCGAMLVTRDGRVAYVNSRLSQMLARPRDEVIGRTVDSFYEDTDALTFLKQRMVHFDEEFEGEFYLPLPDGERVPVITSGRPIRDGQALTDYRVVTFIDISAQKDSEAQANEQYQTLAHLNDVVLDQAIELKHYARDLEDRVRARTTELHTANMEAIYMLAIACEAKDADTGSHVRRIEEYTRVLAMELGEPEDAANRMAYSAILHDVGKMLVPDEILKKPGPLNPQERRRMQDHAAAGERILSKQPFFDVARQIARSHHENWDGTGYPDRLKGEKIPLSARIVHLADVYDALTSKRIYKPPWSHTDAITAIEQERGYSFDPEVTSAFLSLAADQNRWEEIRRS